MPKKDFKSYVCRPYCMFFKEGQKEDMACRGAALIEKMVNRQLIHPNALPRFEKHGRLWKNYKKIFAKYVCSACAFREKDCDFISEACDETGENPMEPCGGFVLLALLVENDFVDMSDLKAVI